MRISAAAGAGLHRGTRQIWLAINGLWTLFIGIFSATGRTSIGISVNCGEIIGSVATTAANARFIHAEGNGGADEESTPPFRVSLPFFALLYSMLRSFSRGDRYVRVTFNHQE